MKVTATNFKGPKRTPKEILDEANHTSHNCKVYGCRQCLREDARYEHDGDDYVSMFYDPWGT